MTYKEKKLAAELGKCAGKWVALDDHKLIACGDSIQEVKKKAKEKNVAKPRIFAVPDSEATQFFF
ncbi:MAG: DUF5678 domain-containing protein [Actinomycetota bacterium]